MNILQIIIGIIILIITSIDIIWSTLWVDGGSGPISNKLAGFIWNVLKRISNRYVYILNFSGPIILMSVLLYWISFIWIGWSFIFIGGNHWLINVNTQEPLGVLDTIYYTGYLIFTLGNGEYTATKGFWKVLTNIASGSGMLFLTMGASYIISIVSGVVEKRSFASSVLSIGKSSQSIIEAMWDGKDFIPTSNYFQSISDQLSTIVFQHKAYPLLRYYHTNRKNKSMPLAIVALDETLSILKYGVEKNIKQDSFMFIKLRADIGSYLDVWHENYSTSIKDPLKIPDLNILMNLNIPVVSEEEFHETMKSLEGRRRKLLALIRADNWEEGDLL